MSQSPAILRLLVDWGSKCSHGFVSILPMRSREVVQRGQILGVGLARKLISLTTTSSYNSFNQLCPQLTHTLGIQPTNHINLFNSSLKATTWQLNLLWKLNANHSILYLTKPLCYLHGFPFLWSNRPNHLDKGWNEIPGFYGPMMKHKAIDFPTYYEAYLSYGE